MRRAASSLLLSSLCPFLWLCFAPAQENQKATAESEKARVFITDSQSWSVAGSGGGRGDHTGAQWQEVRVRKRPRS